MSNKIFESLETLNKYPEFPTFTQLLKEWKLSSRDAVSGRLATLERHGYIKNIGRKYVLLEKGKMGINQLCPMCGNLVPKPTTKNTHTIKEK